jgi:hypothetical protein
MSSDLSGLAKSRVERISKLQLERAARIQSTIENQLSRQLSERLKNTKARLRFQLKAAHKVYVANCAHLNAE